MMPTPSNTSPCTRVEESTKQTYKSIKQSNPTVELSGSRSPVSAEVTLQPELTDNLRHWNILSVPGTHKSFYTRSPDFPGLSQGSRGTVGADATPPPELADNPRHPESPGRGTDKGITTYSPKDNVGFVENILNLNETIAPTSLPRASPSKKLSLGRALSESTSSKSKPQKTYPRRSDRIKARSTVTKPKLPTNPSPKPPSMPITTAPRQWPSLPLVVLTDAVAYDRFHSIRTGQMIANQPSTSRSQPVQSTPITATVSATRTQMDKTAATDRTKLLLQWNINGFYNNLADLELLTQTNQPLVIALQEVHRADVSRMNKTLSGKYRWEYKCGQNIYHSVAIGVDSSVLLVPAPLDAELLVVIRIAAPFPISVVNFYLPNGKLPDLKNRILKVIESIEEPRIIVGDCNGHHPSWGSPLANARGSTLVEVSEAMDLTILNDGSKTFISGQRQSTVDISMSTSSITHKLLWSASEDPLGSDHVPISIFTNDNPPTTMAV